MKVFKRIMSVAVMIAVLVIYIPGSVSFADEYYDMRYFRFLSSHNSGDNQASNVRETDKEWSTDDVQKSGDYFLVDMYEKKEIGKIILRHKQNEYPGKYSVYISNKMEDFGESVITEATGNEGTETIINLPHIIEGRFIKIILLDGTEKTGNSWSIKSLSICHANDETSSIKLPDTEIMKTQSRLEIHSEFQKSIGISFDSFDGKRLSFASVFVKFLNQEPMKEADGNRYADVNKTTKNAAEIEVLANVVEKNSVFYPDKSIILDDALKWILNALGYEKRAVLSGGYPNGYRAWATQLDLLDGVDVGFTDELTYDAATELMYNALMVPTVNNADVEDSAVYDNAAYKWHKVYKVQGNLVSTGITSRSGESLTSGNRIMIGDDVYYDTNGLADDYIGMNVTAYVYAGNDTIHDLQLAYIAPTPNKNNIIVIPGENIDSADNSCVKYCNNIENDSKIRTAQLDIHPDMIYNGKGCTPFDAKKFSVSNGFVKLIDSDNNGKYDLTVIEEYIDYYLGYADKQNKEFSDVYCNPNVRLSAAVVQSYKIYYNGAQIAFDEIPENCILSVMASATKKDVNGVLCIDTDNSSVYTIQVSDKTVSGTCNGKTSEDTVNIDGIEFEPSKQYLYAADNGKAFEILLGKRYKFYLNYTNQFAAVEEISDSGAGYGLLLKTEFFGIESGDFKLSLQLLTTAGKIMTYPVREKVSVDGTTVKLDMAKTKALFYDDVKTEVVDPVTSDKVTEISNQLIPQIIGYTLNTMGEIAKIDTKKYDDEKESKYDSLCHINTERFTCNIYRGMVYPTDNKSTSPNLKIGSPIIFVGPSNIKEADIMSDYEVHSYNYFVQDGKYDMEIFKKSEYNDLELAFIQPGLSSSISSVDYILVDKTGEGITGGEEVKTYIKGVQGTGKFEGYVYSNNVLIKSGLYENGKCTLKRGDMIIVETNSKGEIISISRLFDVDNRDIALRNNGKYYNGERDTIGQVYKNKGNSVMVTSTKRVTEDGAENSLELFDLPSNAIVYDEENDEVRAATSDDIKAYSKIHDEKKTSLVYICTTWGLNTSFVIYNFK